MKIGFGLSRRLKSITYYREKNRISPTLLPVLMETRAISSNLRVFYVSPLTIISLSQNLSADKLWFTVQILLHMCGLKAVQWLYYVVVFRRDTSRFSVIMESREWCFRSKHFRDVLGAAGAENLYIS